MSETPNNVEPGASAPAQVSDDALSIALEIAEMNHQAAGVEAHVVDLDANQGNSMFEEVSEEELKTAAPVVEEQVEAPNDGAETKIAQEDTPTIKTSENVREYFDVFSGIEKGFPLSVELPPESFASVVDSVERSPNVERGGTEATAKWNRVLRDSLPFMPLKAMYSDRLSDPTSSWTQVIEYKGNRLYGSAPALRNKPGTNEVEGGRAILRLVTHLGIGGLHYTPLYNSGFWVYFRPASEVELLELNNIIAQDNVSLGRNSYGLSHSNTTAVAMSRIFDMAIRHVYETSVNQKQLPVSKIADYVSPQDIHALIWGFLCAQYPSGFHYERACSNNPTKCNRVEEGNLNISKTLVVDENRLSDTQKNHMRSYTAGSMTLEQVERYRAEFTHYHDHRFIINEGTPHEVAVTLQSPTMRQFIEQGVNYINSVVNAVTRSFSIEPDNKAREAAIDEYSRAEELCQWLHFIKSIEYGQLSDENNISSSIVKDRDSIREALATLSSVEPISDRIKEEIIKYVENSTISIMAIPTYTCPVCNKDQVNESAAAVSPRMKSYIPLDALQVFFGVFVRRVEVIKNR